jgi:hypothetical protein
MTVHNWERLMVKLDREELRLIAEEIEGIFKAHQAVLDADPPVSRPLAEARDAAQAKYDRISERATRPGSDKS